MTAERAKRNHSGGAQQGRHAGIRPPNPFATCFTRPGALPYRSTKTAFQPTADLLTGLAEVVLQQPAAAICGPHGSGKSTLLAALLPMLTPQVDGLAHHRLRSDTSVWPIARQLIATPRRFLLVVDGWEQLPWPLAAAVLAVARLRGVRLLVTCHRPRHSVPVIWRAGSDRETALAMTESLLADCPRYRAGILRRFEHRWQRSGGNVRELWFGLYDDFEAMRSAEPRIPMTNDRDAACRFD